MLFMDTCSDLRPVITFLKGILTIIQFAIPILLIIMGTVDLGKAVMSSDDKEIKGATSKLIKRAIAAVAVFFVPLLVNLLIGMVANSGDSNASDADNFWTCWSSSDKAGSGA